MYAEAHREKMNEGYSVNFYKNQCNLKCCFRLVCFATYADMKRAKEQMDGKDMNGRCIELLEVADE